MKYLLQIVLTLTLLAVSGCGQQGDVEADQNNEDVEADQSNEEEQDRGSLTTDPVFTDLLRSVSENTIISSRDPSISMQFNSSLRYLGGQKFVLYGVADAEQHFFVETTADNKIKSLYWIQFEAYLPDNSHEYDYEDSPGRLQLNDYEFYLDTGAVLVPADRVSSSNDGSDRSLVAQFLESKGYAYPNDFVWARLVYLPDPSRRKELMMIVIENLETLGLTAPDLFEDGKETQAWPEAEKNFLERIRKNLTLNPLQN